LIGAYIVKADAAVADVTVVYDDPQSHRIKEDWTYENHEGGWVLHDRKLVKPTTEPAGAR
jgi:hypothetical protein